MTDLLLPLLSAMVSGAFATLFLFSAGYRLFNLKRAVAAVGAYRVVPPHLAWPVTFLLVLLEIIVGLWLVMGVKKVGAAVMAAGLLAIFAGAMIVNIARGRRDLKCGCLPGLHATVSGRTAWLNILLANIILYLGMMPRPTSFIEDWVGMALGGVILLLCISGLSMLQQPPVDQDEG
ncbi:MauE/DoxX family redox-associated membrane protein [Gluconobacter wancherniae]|uniref:MauE/DoxX family redox-associated membrane protein n=1 Tax=Gluconobacter wancherniae TaxID=1307955 RepID=UPI001B8B271A|nr:MauE/DoxX family redox-associated membrane protein [Gluconobacter wancherniae]MBS1093111.1 hypothetical protein [Gluconobacter wancherniae]